MDNSETHVARLTQELEQVRSELLETKARLQRQDTERAEARKRANDLQRLEEIELLLEFNEIDELPMEQRQALEAERAQLQIRPMPAEQIPMTVSGLGECWDRIRELQDELAKTRAERDSALAEVQVLRKKLGEEQAAQDKGRWILQETERRLREARDELETLRNERKR